MTDFGRRPAAAAPNVLPKTGQTVSYRDGDDGDYEKGWEGDRFTDNGDGTITDNATNLMYPKDANGAGGNGGVGATWPDALDYAEGLDFAGHTDWRLPNALELFVLLDYGLIPPAVYAIIQNAQNKELWTSTTGGWSDTGAWYWNPSLVAWWYTSKTSGYYFFCCRDA